jgi:hypothetical protein
VCVVLVEPLVVPVRAGRLAGQRRDGLGPVGWPDVPREVLRRRRQRVLDRGGDRPGTPATGGHVEGRPVGRIAVEPHPEQRRGVRERLPAGLPRRPADRRRGRDAAVAEHDRVDLEGVVALVRTDGLDEHQAFPPVVDVCQELEDPVSAVGRQPVLGEQRALPNRRVDDDRVAGAVVPADRVPDGKPGGLGVGDRQHGPRRDPAVVPGTDTAGQRRADAQPARPEHGPSVQFHPGVDRLAV